MVYKIEVELQFCQTALTQKTFLGETRVNVGWIKKLCLKEALNQSF